MEIVKRYHMNVNYPPINWQACNIASVDQLKY